VGYLWESTFLLHALALVSVFLHQHTKVFFSFLSPCFLILFLFIAFVGTVLLVWGKGEGLFSFPKFALFCF